VQGLDEAQFKEEEQSNVHCGWQWAINAQSIGGTIHPYQLKPLEGEEAIIFSNACPLPEGKEAGTIPPAAGGTASPCLTGRARKPADGESEPN
jgi:hypothetical protein